MLRFACAPTADLTLDELRMALMNFVVSKQREERFVIRIEDIDQQRNIEGKDAEIIALLELFGVIGEEVLYQSKNFKFHSAMAIDLLHRKRAFNCFCSKEELDAKEAAAKEQKRLYSYDGTCERLPAEEVIDNPKPFTVRIRKPENDIVFKDKIQGELSFTPDEVDSFVILNVDKTPTHTFATAVDDMLSDISVVIESEEHIEEAPRHIHVRRSLGYDKEIEYAHLPPLLDADIEIKALLEEGFLPEAIANYLLTLGSEMQGEVFTLEEAKERFDLEKIGKKAVKFDKEELRLLNQSHLKLLDDKELSRYVGFADAEVGRLAKLFVDEIGTTRELKERVQLVFEKKEFPSRLQKSAETLKELVTKAPYFDKYEAFEEYLIQKTNLPKEEIEEALYLYLSAKESGPQIEHLYGCLKNYIKEVVA